MAQSLHGDGISINLFHSLWTKGVNKKCGPSINIPDTVVFQFGHASQWYFTGVDGAILRKRKQNLQNDRIEAAFTKRAAGDYDILAYFISSDASGHVENKVGTSIVYFDKKSLHSFLNDCRKECSGILQRFIAPRGTNNSMICAIWSPKLCVLERRINRRQLNDVKFDLYERAITFEGPEMHSTAVPLRGNVLTGKIQHICETIVSHIFEVSERQNKISRMVTNFKVDNKGKVWFLWSTSIRLDIQDDNFGLYPNDVSNPGPLTIDPNYKLPPSVNLGPATVNNPSTDDGGAKKCLSCAKALPILNEAHPVPYKTIIAHFEKVVDMIKEDSLDKNVISWPPESSVINAAGHVGFGFAKASNDASISFAETIDLVIPPIIRQLHTRLKVAGYRRYRRDPLFLHKTCSVCEICFLSYAQLASTGFQIIRPILIEDNDENQHHRGKKAGEFESNTGATREERLRRKLQSKWMPADDPDGVPSFLTRENAATRPNENASLGRSKMNDILSGVPDFPIAITDVLVDSNECDDKAWGLHDKLLQMATDEPFAAITLSLEEVRRRRDDDVLAESMRGIASPQNSESNPLQHLITAYNRMTYGARANQRKETKRKHGQKRNPYEIPLVFADEDDRYSKQKLNVDVAKGLEGRGNDDTKHKDFIQETVRELEDQLEALSRGRIDVSDITI
uniref:Uncharacterized protein n=1 Tax=Leptocylindrus danicus TaxID=163516 RepID=A0A6U2PKG9_9STRA|mmetsp:Transcript_26796/g.39692  ORF Transcript_26796/g.39692 Transcript_26796/m.39692 type:complete len:681 (+) Transcript_26796:920-2962(+)